LQGILNAFEGPFKSQEGSSHWRPYKHPPPQPGRCHGSGGDASAGGRNLPRSSDFQFTEKHPLMDEAVAPLLGAPLLVRTYITQRHRFTGVAVDPQVVSVDGRTYDVVFVGTENGWIIKSVNIGDESASSGVRGIVIEEIKVLENEPVRTLRVTPSPFTGKPSQLIVVGDSVVKALPLHRCNSPKLTTCT
jgi:semaphorin 6